MNERLIREVLHEEVAGYGLSARDLWPAIRRQLLPRPRAPRRGWRVPAGQAFATRARLAASAAAVLVLLLGAILAAPVVARTGSLLPHYKVREIAPSTPSAPVVLPPLPTQRVTYVQESTPIGQRWETLAELEQRAGFVPLLPAHLPPDCPAKEQFSWAGVNLIQLNYRCVKITQQTARSTELPAAAGATEEVSVNGQAALYTRGMWLIEGWTPESGEPKPPARWRADISHRLVLERDGLLVIVVALDQAAVPKEELIRIAASLRPAK